MIKILITGANGQLGSEIKELSSHYKNFNFIFTDYDSLDITVLDKLYDKINNENIDYIINCAAYTNVDKAEEEQEKAEELNSIAVKNIVEVSNKNNIRLIHISTDYVFNGKTDKPYKEDDETCPESVYGKTKLNGENEALKANKHLIIRTSWLYSSFGHNFLKTILRVGRERDEIKVVNDQIGTPTYAADLANAILQIINKETQRSYNNEILHFSNEGNCSWYDFAKEIVSLSGLSCNVIPIPTEEYPLPAKRPEHSILNKEKIKKIYNIEIPSWESSVKKCIEKLNNK